MDKAGVQIPVRSHFRTSSFVREKCVRAFCGGIFLKLNGRRDSGDLLHYTIILVYNVIEGGIIMDMKSESAKLGKNLKRIRTEKGITQGDIVRTLGISRSFVSNIENGKTNPTLSTISNIAKALSVSTDELLK